MREETKMVEVTTVDASDWDDVRAVIDKQHNGAVLTNTVVQLHIAYQLKRIADTLEKKKLWRK